MRESTKSTRAFAPRSGANDPANLTKGATRFIEGTENTQLANTPKTRAPFVQVSSAISRNNMNTISGKINDNYGWEVTVFHKLREASDGVIFFDGKINWDRYLADHSPRFEIHIVIFNYTIIEINIYYLHHRDDEN